MTNLSTIPPLARGSHAPGSDMMCIMEAVAFIAGEPWSDSPQCACPVIATFLRSWNDDLSDDDRDRLLRPLIPLLIGTKSTQDVEIRRSALALDWFIRAYTSAWLRAARLTQHADTIGHFPEITVKTDFSGLMPPLRAAGDAARDAAGRAARDATRYAARDAAGYAAGNAAGRAAGDATRYAAGDAAWDAARDAARVAAGVAVWDAVWVAVWDAAGGAFRPIIKTLQISALDLVRRMIEEPPNRVE